MNEIITKVNAFDPNIVPKVTSVNKPMNHEVINPILFGTASIQYMTSIGLFY